MKQSIFILVALWGLIGTFGAHEKANSQNTIQTQDEQATEMVAERIVEIK